MPTPNAYIANTTDLTAIADAIRQKGETSEPLVFPAEFVEAIEAIEASGGEVPWETPLATEVSYGYLTIQNNNADWVPDQSSTGSKSDLYLINTSHVYLVAMGSTVDNRFRVATFAQDVRDATARISGTGWANLRDSSCKAYDGVYIKPTNSSQTYLVVQKSGQGTANIPTYVLDVTEAISSTPVDIWEELYKDDGVSRLIINIPSNNYTLRLPIVLYSTRDTVIDWGDGQTETTASNLSATEITHTYAKAGDYLLTFSNQSAGSSANFGPCMQYNERNPIYLLGVCIGKKMYVGTGVSFLRHQSCRRMSIYYDIWTIPVTQQMYNVASVDIHNSTNLNDYQFSDCYSLEEIDLSDTTITSLPSGCFRYCYSLRKVVLPSTLTAINSDAFKTCIKLQELDIPASVASIWGGAFNGCSALAKLVIRYTGGVVSTNNANICANTPIASGTGYIYVPDALVEDYKIATNWSQYANQIKGLSEIPT
jgi:hypothetical protein